ncbi:hypothetical protein EYF80_017273 [Liparis tanakae]|uniref:Uncharacterized protein n=1 Tax=Liparis tanakae TaxID=230148 RepID=A0A4Z2I3E0_9TELE|nr:hypothetical protein EYF80_017273 [Liparis tanakae]
MDCCGEKPLRRPLVSVRHLFVLQGNLRSDSQDQIRCGVAQLAHVVIEVAFPLQIHIVVYVPVQTEREKCDGVLKRTKKYSADHGRLPLQGAAACEQRVAALLALSGRLLLQRRGSPAHLRGLPFSSGGMTVMWILCAVRSSLVLSSGLRWTSEWPHSRTTRAHSCRPPLSA